MKNSGRVNCFFSILASNCLSVVSRLTSHFALLAITCSSSGPLPSLRSNTLALGSCLCDNKSKTRQRQAVVLSQKPPRKPCDLCDLRVSASLFRTFSHHVHSLRASYSPFPPRFAEGLSVSDKSAFRRRPQR